MLTLKCPECKEIEQVHYEETKVGGKPVLSAYCGCCAGKFSISQLILVDIDDVDELEEVIKNRNSK